MVINRNKNFNKLALMLLILIVDYFAVVSSEGAAFYLRNWLLDTDSLRVSWLNFWIVFPVVFLLFINMMKLYGHRMTFYKEVEHLFKATCYSTVAIILILYVAHIAGSTSRLFIGVFAVFSFILLTIFRYALKAFLQRYQLLQLPVIIIGAGKTAELLVRSLQNDPGLGYKIIGLLEDNKVQEGPLENYPVLGSFTDVEKVILETGVKRAFIAAPGLDDYKLGVLIYRIQPLLESMGVVTNLVGVPTGSVEAESIFNEKLVILHLKNNLAKPLNRFLKMIFDYVLTVCGVILLSPCLLLIAGWIYLDSPGAIFFKHMRVGKGGKMFPCYKFRSMCVDAEDKLENILLNDMAARTEWEKGFKLKNDPRITRSGAFLRRTSLDELPQILNVLRGEMSLVGPRPVVKEELERYGDFVEDYLMVRPGITGMWQVSGRSDTTYEERVQMDTWYVRNWSVWLDVMLLWRTAKAVIMRKGAY